METAGQRRKVTTAEYAEYVEEKPPPPSGITELESDLPFLSSLLTLFPW
jgi:hypothetical protein